MDTIKTSKILKKTYFLQLLSSVVLVGIAYFLKYHFELSKGGQIPTKTVSLVVISLAGIFGIALPVFYRSYFVYKIRNQKQIDPDAFIRFERILLTTALLTPYFLVVSLLINMAESANILIAIFSLYAAYYYYPSTKKVRFEMKIFRIKPDEKKD